MTAAPFVALMSRPPRTLRAVAWCLQLVLAAGSASWAAALWAAAGPAGRSFAVLVGVSTYPALGPRFDLAGPPNDIDMMGRLLVSRFGFDPDDLVQLSEIAGRERPERLPTRTNILRELEAVAERATVGDKVFVLLAGHGSQQPCAGVGSESGGLDEIFLPRDVGRWQDAPGSAGVANAIVDDEFRAWMRRLRDTGAICWIVFDCCHSGDMARAAVVGNGSDVERSIPPDALTVPASSSVRKADDAGEEEPVNLDNIAILYACQSGEKTVDRRLPDGDAGVACGLLTSTVTRVLETARGPVSYAALTAEVQRLYRAEGRSRGPTPYCEGDSGTTVLSSDRQAGHGHALTLDAVTGRLTLDAGALQAITAGSVLTVHRTVPHPTVTLPDAGAGGSPFGHVRVVEAGLRTSRVEPVAHAGMPAPAVTDLDGASATVVFAAIGDQRLRVACDPGNSGAAVSDGLRARLEALDRLRPIVTFVDSASDPDWTLRGDDAGAILTPRAAAPGVEFRVPQSGGIDGFARSLADLLVRIARADSLVRTASQCRPGSEQGLAIEVVSDSGRWAPGSPVRLQPEERFTLAISNTGTRVLDVTVLHVGADQVITALFPEPLRGETSRFECGDSRGLRLSCDTRTTGREWLVVLTVVAAGAPIDFTGLAVPPGTAERAAGRGPLADLLAATAPATRGLNAAEADACAADVIALDIAK